MMTRKSKQTRYVVWMSDDFKYWEPSVAMTEAEARHMAHQLSTHGWHCRVVPAPTFDPGED
jgi:hypothetical protein